MKRSGVNVYDAMTVNPVTCSSDLSVHKLAQLMIDRGVGSVIVTGKSNGMTGIVTEKDIIKKIVSRGRSTRKLPVKDIMTKKVTVIEPEMDLSHALKLMSDEGIRRLPVLKDKKLVGIVTLKDVLKIQPDLISLVAEKLEIRELERKPFSNSAPCQICGREGKVFNVDGSLYCSACRDRAYKG